MIPRINQQKSSDADLPKYLLKDSKRNCVWHEQYWSRAEAQAKLDYERKENGLDVSHWKIDVVYPRQSSENMA